MIVKTEAEFRDKVDLLEHLRSINGTDNAAIETQSQRDNIRTVFGFPKPAIQKDPDLEPIPKSPIYARASLVAYLQRGFGCQMYTAGTAMPIGRPYKPHMIHDVQSSMFNTANLGLNSGIGVYYANALVLEMDNSVILDVFERFTSDVDELANVPIVVGKKKVRALLKVPNGYRLLKSGETGRPFVSVYGLSEHNRIFAPPSFDRDADGLFTLRWIDDQTTVPVTPSPKLLQWLTTNAMSLERLKAEHAS